MDEITKTRANIGVQNERSLHAALKDWYARPGDQIEAHVDGFIVDIVRADELIEIQTRNLGRLRRKLNALLENHRVRLVYPIAKEKWIVRTKGSKNKILGRRKSPKTGRLSDLFAELVGLPDLINHPNLTFECVLIQEEQIRREDGRAKWRWRRSSLCDRKLIKVSETVTLERKEDFIRFLPKDLDEPFTSSSLAQELGESIHTARQITYCLRKMGTIRMVGKIRNQLLFEIAR